MGGGKELQSSILSPKVQPKVTEHSDREITKSGEENQIQFTRVTRNYKKEKLLLGRETQYVM